MGIKFNALMAVFFLFIFKVNAQNLLDPKIDSLINKMTLQEKILQLNQESGFNTADNTRLDIPGFWMADGPHGVRDGLATCFPVGISMGATWDTELIYRVGVAMGQEFRGKGKHQALGPCMDLTKDPRNGRSSESGGEDPYLVAQITTSLIKGMQSTGCIATAKHYNADSQQNGRMENDYTISQRNLMEHLGLNYRTAVQEGGVLSVMNAYNLINGQKCAENPTLLTNNLRGYWGFPFYVVSDWGSIWNTKNAILAGCNICMGSDNYKDDLENLVTTGQVSVSTINLAVKKVLTTKFVSGMMNYLPDGNPDDVNSTEHQQLTREAGRKSIVLLKNKDNILPLNKDTITKIALIGPSANVAQIDGGGSSYVDPFYTVTPKQGIETKIGADKVVYAKGCDINSTSSAGFAEAVNIAATADVVVFVGGLDASQEGEGYDRVTGSVVLPGKQQDLINMLALVNSNIVVVLESGGICSIQSSINNIKGLLYAFYPGQEGGNAIADVLFGDYNPGGKLPVTMPVNDSQMPERNFNFNDDYGCGYRWYDQQNLTPQFAFGYGLSYTSFEYSNIVVTPSSANTGEKITVSADVKNTGSWEGDEVVQLYLSQQQTPIFFPEKQLKGFKRITLSPGETKNVVFTLTPDDLYYYDETAAAYKVEAGTYTAKVGGSSDNLPLSGTFTLQDGALKPDLRLSWVRTIPAYPIKGDTIFFVAAIKNQGAGIAPAGTAYKISFRMNGEEISKSTYYSDSIKTGSIAFVTSDVAVAGLTALTGTYNVEAVIDPDNNVDEYIEDNNSVTVQYKVYPKPASNLALHKQAFVSSTESSLYPGSYAVDGNYGTRWASAFSDPQYIYVDLGSVQHFTMVKIHWEAAYGKNYNIQVSDNASNWTVIKSVQGGDGGVDIINVDTSARYVKLYGTSRATQYGYSIYEFEVYNADPVSVQPEDNYTALISDYILKNNYPNPFNPSTNISYYLPAESKVNLAVYNLLGETVTVLTDEIEEAGSHEKIFNAGKLASGVYLYRLEASSLDGRTNFIEAKKLILLK